MAKNVSRRPDWTANALDKDSGIKGRVGAAWTQDDGSIQILFDPWVVLQGRGHNSNLLITLFPYDPEGYEKYKAKQQKEREQASAATPAAQPKGKFDDMEDDIPF